MRFTSFEISKFKQIETFSLKTFLHKCPALSWGRKRIEFVVENRFFALKGDPLLYNAGHNPFGYWNNNQFLCVGLNNF